MGVKLFRATEFAESQGFQPGEQQRALHPAWLVAFGAFWMAVPGNWVLWQALLRVPDLEAWRGSWLLLRLALALTLLCAALLLAGAWRRTLRIWTTLALALTALASLSVAGQGQLRLWQAVLCVLLLAVVPALLVWRVRWRRLPLARQAGLALGGTLLCALAAGLLLILSYRDLSALQARAPGLARLAVPFGPLGASAGIEQILLRRQP